MSENYFTGEFKTDQNNTSTAAASLNQSQTCEIKEVQQNSDKMNLQQKDNDQNLQEQQKKQQIEKEQQDEFVDAKEIIVQNQQVDEEKFIQNNPTIAAQQKKQGNQNYSQGQYSDALVNYRKSLQYTDNQSEEDIKFRSIIYSNIGLTYMKMYQEDNAIQYFQKSLKLNQKYTKARTNLAQCYENTQKLQQALQEYKKVLQTNPNDAYVRQKVIPLEVKVKDLQEKRKQEVMSGLKNIGNSILGYFGMSLDNFKLQQGPGGGYNISFKQ